MAQHGAGRFRATLGLAALGAAVLAGCASPTPYQPTDGRTGYFTQPVESNRFLVGFRGNDVTSRATVETYLLYRAAETTVETGHDYFVIIDSDVERDVEFFTTFDDFGAFRFGRFDRFDRFGTGFGTGFVTGRTRSIDRYQAFATIRVFEGEKPADDPQAYDAHEVLETLGPQIVRAPPDP